MAWHDGFYDEDTLQLLKNGASFETVANSLEQWKSEEEKRQRDRRTVRKNGEREWEEIVELR